MLRTSLRLYLSVVAALPYGCLPTQDIASDAATLPTPEVRAFDAQGRPAALERLPRRPRLQISLGTPLNPGIDAPWLLSGPCDDALLTDLDKLPLSAAHRASIVETRRRSRGPVIEIEPLAPLDSGAVYTLALPRTAAKHLSAAFTATLQVDDSPRAGASFRASFPAADAAGVPRDLAYALITFDGAISGAESGLWLEDDRGFAHPGASEIVACRDYDHAAVSCIQWHPQRPLAAASRYTLRSGAALTDAHGATIPELHVSFATQSDDDAEAPPQWQRTICGVDEQELPVGCAMVGDTEIGLRLSRNPLVRLVVELGAERFAVLPSAGSTQLRFGELAADSDYTIKLTTYDARLYSETNTWLLRTAAPLPTLSITEVYADPVGREPDQEYVELWNYGGASLELGGLLLSDNLEDLGRPLASEVRLAPDARALLVSDAFDAAAPEDVSPSPGCLLVRVGKALTRGGLSNAGEPLFLRTAQGVRISAAPDSPAPAPGQCLVRASDDPRHGEPGSFVRSAAGCSPGR